MTTLVAFLALATAHTNEGSFDSNGVKISYLTAGQGEAVVLIHGWMSEAANWGRRDSSGKAQLNTSAGGFQIIAIDCRGHGKSDKPHEPDKYGIEMAEDVVRLLDHLKIEKAHLVGYSMGAFIAGNVAAKHPGRVRSVVYGAQAPLLAGAQNGSPEVDVFAKAAEEGNGFAEYILFVTPPDRPKPSLDHANLLAKFMLDGKDVKALAAAGRSFPALAVSVEDLRKCSAPSLFIYGSKEPERLKTRVEGWRKDLGRGELKVIEGADHRMTLIHPEFGGTILEFLRAHSGK
jgi:pimeloyl-ACP methyl ester carboxylesterase